MRRAVLDCGPVIVLPEKTRIAFQVRMSFAQVSPRRNWLDGHLVLARRLPHPRFRRIDTISPRNHVHHFRLTTPREIDAEFRRWLAEAYAVGAQEHLRPSRARRRRDTPGDRRVILHGETGLAHPERIAHHHRMNRKEGAGVGGRVALLRGVNVGRAKRIAMADLRSLLEELGYAGVRTLLNSGNIVFRLPPVAPGGRGSGTVESADASARRIEAAILRRFGFSSRVTVLSGDDVARAVHENPLAAEAHDPSRLLVAFPRDAASRRALATLARDRWSPEAFALGSRVAYLWCPGGVLESPVAGAVNRALGEDVTTRNWTTVLKLHALVTAPGGTGGTGARSRAGGRA